MTEPSADLTWLTEAEWQAAAGWLPMLNQVRTRTSTRKFLLLAVALCRRVWDRLPDDGRRAVEAAERLADHPEVEGDDVAVAGEVEAVQSKLREAWHRYQDADPGPKGAFLAAFVCTGLSHDPDGLIESVANSTVLSATGEAEGPAHEAERHAQALLLQELFGNPFRPVAFDPSWRTPAVALARSIYEDRAFDRMPALADALEEAGCGDSTIIGHCRAVGAHARGCWVVDGLLGRA